MISLLRAAFLVGLVACVPADDEPLPPEESDPPETPVQDADRDGWPADEDCDDTDPTVHPGADEVPADGVDQDCDGFEHCWTDADGDGFGGALVDGPLDCTGLAVRGGDCDDEDEATHPGAAEDCSPADRDCDGETDDAADRPLWRLDRDGDGFGSTVTYAACTAPPGYVAADAPVDCDDLDPLTHPGADEIAGDGIDQDCDGVEHCFRDEDFDGFGAGAPFPGVTLGCTGFFESRRGDDCDDRDHTVHPGAVERCGEVDHDCDGVPGDLDDDAVDPPTWYRDRDEDGFGAAGAPVIACLRPSGTTASAGDCNDDDPFVHPGAEERCNHVDDDCDGLVDDADDDVVDVPVWHEDRDRDRFGNPDVFRVQCFASGLFDIQDDRDCDDLLALRNPDAIEVYGNAIDEDCDGRLGCFIDADGDGLAGPGREQVPGTTCDQPGYGATIRDCDDTDPAVGLRTFYRDGDGDGFGDPFGGFTGSCVPPTGYVDDTSDCDDRRPDVHPGAPEEPGDGVDADCNGTELCFVDADGDGFGTDDTVPSADLTCAGPGTAAVAGDCDDDDPAVSPAAVEAVGDGIDGDCDGTELCFADLDGDGHGGRLLVTVAGVRCDLPGVSAVPDDCDDDDGNVHPRAPERCDGVDDDCNGLVDDEDPLLVDAPVWYRDGDGDGRGAAEVRACIAPPGTVARGGDCDDARAAWVEACPWAIVAAGDGVTCGLRTDGTVACEGLGDVVVPDELVALDVGGRLVCGVTGDGGLTCFGDAPPDDPRRAVPDGVFVDVAVDGSGACALRADGVVVCWGDLAAPDGAFHDAAVGAGAACAVGSAGLACTGAPVCTDGVGPGVHVAVGAPDGEAVACVLDAVGRLRCGVCGPEAPAWPDEPLLRFLDVALGGAGACAVTATGDVTCWAGAAPDLAGALAVTVGETHGCALLADRSVACWGEGPALPGPE